MDSNSFYEEDEPVEEVVAAFNSGARGVTVPPPFHVVYESTNIAGSSMIFSTPSLGAPVTEWAGGSAVANVGGGEVLTGTG